MLAVVCAAAISRWLDIVNIRRRHAAAFADASAFRCASRHAPRRYVAMPRYSYARCLRRCLMPSFAPVFRRGRSDAACRHYYFARAMPPFFHHYFSMIIGAIRFACDINARHA